VTAKEKSMTIIKAAAGCAVIASALAALAGHPIKAVVFGACAVVLMAGWLWQARRATRDSKD